MTMSSLTTNASHNMAYDLAKLDRVKWVFLKEDDGMVGLPYHLW